MLYLCSVNADENCAKATPRNYGVICGGLGLMV
jgi:hypothetical protein